MNVSAQSSLYPNQMLVYHVTSKNFQLLKFLHEAPASPINLLETKKNTFGHLNLMKLEENLKFQYLGRRLGDLWPVAYSRNH